MTAFRIVALGLLLAGSCPGSPADEVRSLVGLLGDHRRIERQEEAFGKLLEMGKAHPADVLAVLEPEDPDPAVARYCREIWKLIQYETGALPRPNWPVKNASFLFQRHLVCEVDLVGIDLNAGSNARRVKELLSGREGVVGVELVPAEGRVRVRFLDHEAFDHVQSALILMHEEGIEGEIRKQPEAFLGHPQRKEREAFERYLQEKGRKGKEQAGEDADRQRNR